MIDKPRHVVEYGNPPLIEVACDISFNQLAEFTVPYFGLLWTKFRNDFPECKEAPPLVGPDSLEFSVTETPHRLWFLDQSQREVIQIQQDRFVNNWRKIQPDDQYPRYAQLIKTFRQRFEILKKFTSDNDIGEIQPRNCQLTYTNHIPQGDGWTKIGDLTNVFSALSWKMDQQGILSSPTSVQFQTSFKLADDLGTLVVTGRTAMRRIDKRMLLLLELNLYGKPSEDDVWAWFDQAHETLIKSFMELTNDEIQTKIWRRKSG